MGHYPIRSAGEHGDTDSLLKNLLPILTKYNVQAYFNGHDHISEHLSCRNSSSKAPTNAPTMNPTSIPTYSYSKLCYEDLDYFVVGSSAMVDDLGDVEEGALTEATLHWSLTQAVAFASVQVTSTELTVTYINSSQDEVYSHTIRIPAGVPPPGDENTTLLFYSVSIAGLISATGISMFMYSKSRLKEVTIKEKWQSLNSPKLLLKSIAKDKRRYHRMHSSINPPDTKISHSKFVNEFLPDNSYVERTWKESLPPLNQNLIGLKIPNTSHIPPEEQISSIDFLATDPGSPLSNSLRTLLRSGILFELYVPYTF